MLLCEVQGLRRLCCYAQRGTGLGYAAMQSAVLAEAKVLCGCCAKSGTELGCAGAAGCSLPDHHVRQRRKQHRVSA
eukprot:1162352-Rhodomonas_salina.1